MPKFIQLKSPAGDYTYYVNPEQVRFFQPSKAGYTVVIFDKEQSLNTSSSPEEILRKIEG